MPVNLFKSTFAVVLLAVDYSALHQGGLSVMVVLSARDACPGWPVCHGWWWRSLLEVPAQGGLSVMGGGGTLYARCLPRVACLSWVVVVVLYPRCLPRVACLSWVVVVLSTRGACPGWPVCHGWWWYSLREVPAQGGLSVMGGGGTLREVPAQGGLSVMGGGGTLREVPAQGGLSVMGGGGTLYARCLPRVACLSWAVAALSTRRACLVCRCLNLPVCKALVGQCIYIRCSSGLDVHAC